MGEEESSLYQLQQRSMFGFSNLSLVNQILHLWHYTLGCITFSNIKFLNNSMPNLQITKSLDTFVCTICPLLKQRCLSFPFSETYFICIYDLIHCDLWGPSSVSTLYGSKFFLTNVDDFSKSTWEYLLKTKAQTKPYLQSFFNLVETQFQSHTKKIRTNNRIKFYMLESFSFECVIHQKSCVEKP